MLMDGAWPVTGTFLVLVYLMVVYWIGPKFMEERKPYQLREVLIVYNFAMVLLSLYMVIEVSSVIYSVDENSVKLQISSFHLTHGEEK